MKYLGLELCIRLHPGLVCGIDPCNGMIIPME
jgi:hypothetical protein